jgi:outer membrane protein
MRTKPSFSVSTSARASERPPPISRLRTAFGTLIAVAALVVIGWLQPWQYRGAAAQKLPTTVAAVIDYQRVLRDAAAARSIRQQIEARRKVYQEEISKEEQRLHEADKEFAKQRSVLSPEAFAEKRREFEQDVAEVQRMVQKRRRELDRISAAALNEVKEALIEIVTSIAEERGFNLVLPTSEVLFFSRSLDLTEEVLAKLDARLPQVPLSALAGKAE